MKLLITGVSGKVGQNFLAQILTSEMHSDWSFVALCNNRVVQENERLRVERGSIADKAVIARAMGGVTHVLHLAAVKESPEQVIDVGVKGMFLLLEAFNSSRTAQQFILMGGDCSVGHIFHDYPAPINEDAPRKAYPGCYALTKVIEEVMLEQYQYQYGINGCVLRAPWIMEKDDFRCAMSFGLDQFGGPLWSTLLSASEVDKYAAGEFAPVILDVNGAKLRRNFIHVDDVVTAIIAALDNPAASQQLFNISMNEPVDYGAFGQYLEKTRNYQTVEIASPFFSNWLDNAKARLLLGWKPEVSLEELVERAWNYKRGENDPRKIWYPG